VEQPAPPDRVFVYGTLRAAGGHPMARLLAARGRRLGPATLSGGVLLDVGPYPAAVPSSDPDDRIVGELIELDSARATETLAELDAYEGCPDGDHEPALYVRTRRVVSGPADEPLAAWVWFWNRGREGLPRIADGDWIRHLRG
jgi:gamma-glutamylcyclotransferase (GGCT)/AIG2-like uncharacterized protein YtfP